jgi:hypothetical protein
MDRFPRALTPPPLPPPRRVVRHFTPAPPNYGDFPRVSTEASCADARALLESFETLTSLTVCPRPRHPPTTTRHPPPASRGPWHGRSWNFLRPLLLSHGRPIEGSARNMAVLRTPQDYSLFKDNASPRPAIIATAPELISDLTVTRLLCCCDSSAIFFIRISLRMASLLNTSHYSSIYSTLSGRNRSCSHSIQREIISSTTVTHRFNSGPLFSYSQYALELRQSPQYRYFLRLLRS